MVWNNGSISKVRKLKCVFFLYLFRHGQTDMNIVRRYQGQLLNEKLNAEGVKQAKELAVSFADCPLEIIYSSPLRRAYETARILQDYRGVPLRVAYDLIEADHGVADGMLREEIVAAYPEEFRCWRNLEEAFIDSRFERGESKREIRNRAVRVLLDIASCGHTHIAVATHSMVLRCLLTYFGKLQADIPHAQIIRLVAENGKLSLL